MILFGTKTFIRVKGVSDNLIVCSQCDLETHFELQHIWRWFTLFFIPIFPFWVNRVILCPHCGYGIKVNRKNAQETLENIEDHLE